MLVGYGLRECLAQRARRANGAKHSLGLMPGFGKGVGGYKAQMAVRMLAVVFASPVFDDDARFGQGQEPLLLEACLRCARVSPCLSAQARYVLQAVVEALHVRGCSAALRLRVSPAARYLRLPAPAL